MLFRSLGIQLAQRRNPDFAAVLDAWYETKLKPSFSGKVLPVEWEVAEICAQLHAARPRSFRDALIGATALVHGLAVATRNLKDFADMGLELANPWER